LYQIGLWELLSVLLTSIERKKSGNLEKLVVVIEFGVLKIKKIYLEFA